MEKHQLKFGSHVDEARLAFNDLLRLIKLEYLLQLLSKFCRPRFAGVEIATEFAGESFEVEAWSGGHLSASL